MYKNNNKLTNHASVTVKRCVTKKKCIFKGLQQVNWQYTIGIISFLLNNW